MSADPQTTGRTLLVFLVLAAVALLVALVVVVADPFGIGEGVLRDEAVFAPGDLREEAGGAAGEADGREGAGGLVGRYGVGDLGAIRLRLLHVVGHAPLADHPLRLVARTGTEWEMASGADGVVVFAEVAPGRGYRLEIDGAEHAPVTIQGVEVLPARTTDLGDIVLGENIVLRGRVVDGTSRPLPGTSVAVYTPRAGMLADGFFVGMVDQATRFPAPVEQTRTDETGWFTLSALTDGTYRLEARHSGFATRYETDVVVSQDRPARAMTIVLGEGATVKGKVVDEDDKAVAGARVVAVRDAGRGFLRGGATLERDVAFTDEGGRYLLDTLAPGTSYRFGVLADGYAPLFEMNTEELKDRILEKDFQLVLGGTIEGRVVRKDDGRPIMGVRVVVAVGRMFGPGGRGRGRGGRVGRGGGGGSGDSEGGEAQRVAAGQARTDEDGCFRIENMLPGPILSAQAKASGYVTFTASPFGGNSWGEVDAGQVLEVAIELERGGVIEGTITDATSGAVLVDAEVTVLPRSSPWRVLFTGSPHARTNSEGRYVLSGVMPGTYGVVAAASGYAASDPAADDTKVVVSEAGGTSTRDVGLSRAGRVTGTVRNSSGELIAGARVRSRAAPRPRTEGDRRGSRRGPGGLSSLLPGGSGADLTDQSGRFVIEDVSSDRQWILEAEADEYVGTESKPFGVGAGEEKEVDLVLTGGGNLEGRVVDDHGRFVEGVRVRVGQVPAARMGRGSLMAWEVDRYLDPQVYFTDEDGCFVAVSLRPGRAVVKAECDGYVTFYKQNVVIRADETVENYTVALTKGDVMEGKVRGAKGRPIEGAFVALTKRMPGEEEEETTGDEENEEIEPRLSARTDGDGRYQIEDIPPGVYNVVVYFAPGHVGWARDRSEKAIRRGIASSATNADFQLDAATTASPLPRGPRGR